MSKPLTPHAAYPPGGTVIAFASSGRALIIEGTAAPSDATAGYEGGAIFLDTDTGTIYVNEATSDSCDFNRISTEAAQVLGDITTGSITNSGAIASSGRITTTDGVASGTARVVGGLAYSNTAASTAIASTSAETAFSTSYTIPANTLKAGTVVKINFQGIGTTVVGTDTLAYKLYIGGLSGTALITSAATTMVNNHTFNGQVTLICRTAGATGTFVSSGFYKVNSAEGTMTVKDDIVASTTINTTAAQDITMSATFNTTNANSVRLDVLTVEIT